MIFTYEILHISATTAPPIISFRDYANDYISYMIGDTKWREEFFRGENRHGDSYFSYGSRRDRNRIIAKNQVISSTGIGSSSHVQLDFYKSSADAFPQGDYLNSNRRRNERTI